MNFHKILVILIIFVISLSACSKEQTIEKTTEKKEKESFVKAEELEGYLIKTPFKFGLARGLITENISNKLDINELELGLMEFSTEYFSTKKYSFQEGQYLSEENIEKWTSRRSNENPEGLNPKINLKKERLEEEKENPIILSHILEQNYVDKDGKLAGISIALTLNKINNIRYIEDGLLCSDSVQIENKVILQKGKQIAEELLQKIKQNKNIPDVPIFLTLYQLEKPNTVIPGKFLKKTYISSEESKIKKWDDNNRVYYVLTDSSFEKVDKQINDILENFKEDIEVNFQGANINFIGKGLYINNELSSVEIDIEAMVISKTQSTALAQFVGNQLIQSAIPKYMPITVHIGNGVNELFLVKWDPTKEKVITHELSN